ncbi:MAG TPA: hypothetical protein VF008_14990 [Niastella sp.]
MIIPFFTGTILLFAPILNYKRTKSDHLTGYLIDLREKVIIKGEKVVIKDNFLLIMAKNILITQAGVLIMLSDLLNTPKN